MMLIPKRLLLIAAFTTYAFASIALGDAGGHGAPPVLTPEQQAALAASAGLPPGTSFEVFDKTSKGGTVTEEKKGVSTGASGKVVGDKLQLTIDGKPMVLSLKDFGLVQGGGFESHSDAQASPGGWWTDWKFYVGIVCLLGAGFLWLAPKFAPTLIKFPVPAWITSGLAIAGGCLVFAAFFPVLATILTVTAIGFVIGPKIIGAVQQANLIGRLTAANTATAQQASAASATAEAHSSALDEVMEAIVNDPAATAALKKHMDLHADDGDVPLITERFKAAGGRFA